jgi:hypothetical protein
MPKREVNDVQKGSQFANLNLNFLKLRANRYSH